MKRVGSQKRSTRLPEFLMQRQDFHPRGSGRPWSPLRSYHVALEDSYVRENWDCIDALCKYNRVPFDRAGERVQSWIVHEFAVQLDAMMFWDEFRGRWLTGPEFVYPEYPASLLKMKRPAHWRDGA
jgi:hypothetical protein